jgi:hypothetical protein
MQGWQRLEGGTEQQESGSEESGSTKTGSTKAGSTKAGSTKAGSTKAGSTKAGSTKAGSTKAGSKETGSESNTHVPVNATVRGPWGMHFAFVWVKSIRWHTTTTTTLKVVAGQGNADETHFTHPVGQSSETCFVVSSLLNKWTNEQMNKWKREKENKYFKSVLKLLRNKW